MNFTGDEMNAMQRSLGVPVAAKIQAALKAASAGAGTVTSVSSANTDINVANGTTAPVLTVNKDGSGGLTGLTLFKINFKNVLNTFTSFFTNSNTAARTYTFPDKNGTVAMISDLPASGVATVTGDFVDNTDPLNPVLSYQAWMASLPGYDAGADNQGVVRMADGTIMCKILDVQ